MFTDCNRTESILARNLKHFHEIKSSSLIYDNDEEWKTFSNALVRSALENGEKCYYAYGTHSKKQVLETLAAIGPAVITAESAGQLKIQHGSKLFAECDLFDPDSLLACLIDQTKKALAQGFSSLCVTIETEWILRELPVLCDFTQYDIKLNKEFFPEYPARVVWQFDQRRFSPEFINDIIVTHPQIINHNHAQLNYYHMPVERFLGNKRFYEDSKYLLGIIIRENEREKELERTSQYLDILFRKTSDIVFIAAADGNLIDANEAALEFIECSIEELTHKRIQDVLALDDSIIQGGCGAQFASNPIEVEYLIHGQLKFLSMTLTPVNTRDKLTLFGIGHKIDRSSTNMIRDVMKSTLTRLSDIQ